MMDLEAALPSQPSKHRFHCRVLDFGDFPDVLDLGINDAMPMLEKRRKIPTADVAIFVDGGREDRATVEILNGVLVMIISEIALLAP